LDLIYYSNNKKSHQFSWCDFYYFNISINLSKASWLGHFLSNTICPSIKIAGGLNTFNSSATPKSSTISNSYLSPEFAKADCTLSTSVELLPLTHVQLGNTSFTSI
jgi:hypothetical protein